MLLLAKTVEAFLPFLQLLGWIVLVLLLLSSLIIAIVHYRRRAKKDDADTFQEGTAEQIGYTTGNGEYILFDHSSLISRYKLRLSVNEARFAALQQDYTRLNSRYTQLALATTTHSPTTNQQTMETASAPLSPELEQDIARITAAHMAEKEMLEKELEQLNRSYRQLEQEHELLRTTINVQASPDDEKTQLIRRWQEEISYLRSQVTEQDYLQDMLSEKKMQIDFLQQQLEQRVRLQHEADRHRVMVEESAIKQQQELKNLQEQAAGLRQQLQESTGKTDQLLTLLGEREEELQAWEQRSKLLTEHTEKMQIELSNSREQLVSQEAVLARERAEMADLQDRLTRHQQSLRRIHQDFLSCLDAGDATPPVIALHVAEIQYERS